MKKWRFWIGFLLIWLIFISTQMIVAQCFSCLGADAVEVLKPEPEVCWCCKKTYQKKGVMFLSCSHYVCGDCALQRRLKSSSAKKCPVASCAKQIVGVFSLSAEMLKMTDSMTMSKRVSFVSEMLKNTLEAALSRIDTCIDRWIDQKNRGKLDLSDLELNDDRFETVLAFLFVMGIASMITELYLYGNLLRMPPEILNPKQFPGLCDVHGVNRTYRYILVEQGFESLRSAQHLSTQHLDVVVTGSPNGLSIV